VIEVVIEIVIEIVHQKAEYLILVLYSREQIDAEAKIEYDNPKPFIGDWGIVSIMGQSHTSEEPMKPETMIRNALGKEEGGSGVELNRDDYMKSVKFWNKNATIKT